MAQKRHYRRRPRTRSKQPRGRQPKKRVERSLENTILKLLFDRQSPVTARDISMSVSGRRSLDGETKSSLDRLLHSRIIQKEGKKHFLLSKKAPLYSGPLQQHPRGFGFVTPQQKHDRAPDLDRDLFISPKNLGTARHGDIVLVRLISARNDSRPEGMVVAVLDRGPDIIAGFFRRGRRGTFVYPEDSRYPFVIRLSERMSRDIPEGHVVLAQIHPAETAAEYLPGTIVEVLGPPDSIDVQMRLVIEKHQLPNVFSEETLREAAALSAPAGKITDREDLRHIQHVTIDGESAKDFDDAVAVVKAEHGFRLYVSIADVSYFVEPGSAIDRDGYQRGTSIYFPGRVIPMLPEKLSNNLCSLVPHEDRLAVTAVLDFDNSGKRVGKQFCRSVIRSHNRFTYTTVAKILIDKDEKTRTAYPELLEMLEQAEELARKLLAMRVRRGSIGFVLPEPEIELADDGRIQSIKKAQRNFAHQIIEEFMLAANEAVAETFTEKKRQCLYRIHELPDIEKLTAFSTFAKTLDLSLPAPELTPQWFGQALDLCRDTPREYIVNNLLLRTMQQARYSPDNRGHFALAAENYTHFTSPIRRYPDLVVHRELCKLIRSETAQTSADFSEFGEFLSARERKAVDAEREMADRLKLLYMEKHLGESFPAIISGVTEFMLFVELTDLFISGAIPIESFKDDYYLFDQKHHRIIGEISAKIYQIGDLISVTAVATDKNKQRIVFEPTATE